jgi:hypothetical protein
MGPGTLWLCRMAVYEGYLKEVMVGKFVPGVRKYWNDEKREAK